MVARGHRSSRQQHCRLLWGAFSGSALWSKLPDGAGRAARALSTAGKTATNAGIMPGCCDTGSAPEPAFHGPVAAALFGNLSPSLIEIIYPLRHQLGGPCTKFHDSAKG